MAHALGEVYYLTTLMEQRRKKIEEQKEQGQQTIHTGLVFISPRVPSDTGKPVETIVHTDDGCMIA